MNTDDRRVRKTKKALQDGLAELMLEKDLRKITVRELTDRVDIHRATFYVHYTDVYDLYEQMENAALEELSAILAEYTYDGVYRLIIDYIHNNAKLSQLLLDKKLGFYDKLSDFLEMKCTEIILLETGLSEIPEEFRYFAAYHIQGCLGVISRWAKGGFVYPKEKIIAGIERLDAYLDAYLEGVSE